MSVWDALDNNKILQGDCLEVLKTLPDECVDTCVTSPPYYGLRDYGTGEWIGGDPNCKHESAAYVLHPEVTAYEKVCRACGAIRVDHQIGLEDTPEQYVQRLVDVFREVKRVLKADGTLWVNIGDSYNGSGGNHKSTHKNDSGFQGAMGEKCGGRGNHLNSCKPKDLIGIPWLLAFALRSDGWYLRQDIIWHKPNPMPESVKDRCTKSHEYVFLLSKNPRYYFDYEAIAEDTLTFDLNVRDRDKDKLNNTPGRSKMHGLKTNQYEKRNKRDVWSVNVHPTKEAHFATFPEKLIEPCILAGSKPGGIVLDPFFGSGTTGVVANKFNRSFIGIELNKEYIELAKKRTADKQITLEGVI